MKYLTASIYGHSYEKLTDLCYISRFMTREEIKLKNCTS